MPGPSPGSGSSVCLHVQRRVAPSAPDDTSDPDGGGVSAEDGAALPCLCAGQLTHDAGTDREFANNGACP